jgi:hypothetical protein
MFNERELFNRYEEKRLEFEEEYKASMEIMKTFGDYMVDVMELKPYNKEKFKSKTGLSGEFYSRVKGYNYRPRMRVFMSLIKGYDLDMKWTLLLLKPFFREFDLTKKEHCAYIHLIIDYPRADYIKCNEVLKGLGIAEKHLLGSHQRI